MRSEHGARCQNLLCLRGREVAAAVLELQSTKRERGVRAAGEHVRPRAACWACALQGQRCHSSRSLADQAFPSNVQLQARLPAIMPAVWEGHSPAQRAQQGRTFLKFLTNSSPRWRLQRKRSAAQQGRQKDGMAQHSIARQEFRRAKWLAR